MKIEKIKELDVYTDVFFKNPSEVFSILNDLERIKGHYYAIDIYESGDFLDFPVFIEQNSDKLSKLFDVDKYLERLNKNYSYEKEVNGKPCIGLLQLAEDFLLVHNINIYVGKEDLFFYDPNEDDNFDYYYKMSTANEEA